MKIFYKISMNKTGRRTSTLAGSGVLFLDKFFKHDLLFLKVLGMKILANIKKT